MVVTKKRNLDCSSIVAFLQFTAFTQPSTTGPLLVERVKSKRKIHKNTKNNPLIDYYTSIPGMVLKKEKDVACKCKSGRKNNKHVFVDAGAPMIGKSPSHMMPAIQYPIGTDPPVPSLDV